MDPDFWRARWQEGRTAFHEGRPNSFLEQHVARLGERRRVLVPLCGKAADLEYLAALGHQVVGVELVEDAVRAFFSERALTPQVAPQGALTAWRAGAVTVLAGDFFAVTKADTGPVDALYDRAALIALPEALRARYVAHVRQLLAPASPGLVVTVDYPQDAMAGPPFSVPEAEVRHHYAGAEVTLLSQAQATGGRLGTLGERAHDRCFFVRS